MLGTSAYNKLFKLLSSTRLVNDIKKLSPDVQTSCLEGFHSTLNTQPLAPKDGLLLLDGDILQVMEISAFSKGIWILIFPLPVKVVIINPTTILELTLSRFAGCFA